MYYIGTGVPQDSTEAVRLFRLAAAQGYTQAQFNLGTMYYIGTGVPQDYTEAVRLYRLAAAQGGGKAQCNLGRMYYIGTGVPQDYTEAARLLKLADDQGFPPARKILGHVTAQYPAGTRVRITGLVTAANLSSRLVTAVQPTKPLAAGLIAVRIDGHAKSVSLSWANVQHV